MKASNVTSMPAILLLTVLSLSTIIEPAAASDKKRSLDARKDRVESVIIGKFATELELTPKQSEQFFPLFGRFRTDVQALQRRHRDARLELDQLATQENVNQARVDELLNQIDRNQAEGLTLKRQFLKDVSTFLTPQQVSRCSVLLDELPRRLHELLNDRRQRKPR